jgi:hypothetical protein
MKKIDFPFYPLLFAAFPTLALMANNLTEVRFTVSIRPLVVSIMFGMLLFIIALFLYKKHWHKAALITGVSIILFFSFGHLSSLLKSIPAVSEIGRYSYVLSIYGLIWIGVLILTIRKKIKPDFSKLMNIVSIILIVIPSVQIGVHHASEAITYWKLDPSQETEADAVAELGYAPDIYYIILDSYSRPDALLENYDLDMTDFIEDMEGLGFYYASESHSNYNETFGSLSTSLNLEYITDILEERDIERNSAAHRDLLIHNEVRGFLESLGYETVAFTTGYKWSEMDDADFYYEVTPDTIFYEITPFESLLIKNLIVYPFQGYISDLINIDLSQQVDSPHQEHIDIELNILETLPKIAKNRHPTFTFAHLIIPHIPYVFDVDGSILEDPGYNSADEGYAVNETYELDGYKKAVQFISQQMLIICQQILENSDAAPIIIIQSDHGWKDDHRYKILNLYYFPDGDYNSLYPSISPVNSFRVVLSEYFSMDYGIIEDKIFE